MNVKRFVCALFFCAVSAVALRANAAVGDVAGYVYSTDICAYVDEMPIGSYNIGGKTAIVAEDLAAYGFDVQWNEKDRFLFVYTKALPETAPQYTPTKQKTGDIVGKIYETDIVAYVNGMWAESYNLGGKTVLVIEDLGTEDDAAKRSSRDGNPYRQIGYSNALMKFDWSESARVISLFCIRPGKELKSNFGDVTVDSIYKGTYSRGAYSLLDYNENILKFWVTFIEYDGKKYINTAELSESENVFEELKFENGNFYAAKKDYENILYDRASTTGSCSGNLLVLKSENADALLYGGDVYVNIDTLNSVLGENFLLNKRR